jgi:hypothetical protein
MRIYDSKYFENDVFNCQIGMGRKPFVADDISDELTVLYIYLNQDSSEKIETFGEKHNSETEWSINQYVRVHLNYESEEYIVSIAIRNNDGNFRSDEERANLFKTYIEIFSDIYKFTLGDLNYITEYFTKINMRDLDCWESYIGLYGEVSFIKSFDDEKCANILLDAYQSKNNERIDFNVSKNIDFEIKSTIGSKNEFTLKHDQLINRLDNSYLVTVNLIANPNGLKCSELIENMESKFNFTNKNVDKLDDLLSRAKLYEYILANSDIKFDHNVTHVRCYQIVDVPKLTTVDPLISNIVYRAHFNTDKAVKPSEIIESLLQETQSTNEIDSVF